MQTNHSIEQILSDLEKMQKALLKMEQHLWRLSTKEQLEFEELPEFQKLQDLIVLYLLANCGFIEHCLNKVYSETTVEQRRTIGSQDLRIDSSAVTDGFKAIAIEAIRKAKTYWYTYTLSHLKADDLNMLHRGLVIATHHIYNEPKLIYFHPIEEHLQNLGL